MAARFIVLVWSVELTCAAVDEKTSAQWNACPLKEQPSTRCRWR